MEQAIETEVNNVFKNGDVNPCYTIYHQTIFFLQERRYPSNDELTRYLNQHLSFSINPEQHHQENKVQTPTKNLEKLVPSIVEKGGDCCLCLETIQKGELAFILPCKHVYHSEGSNCAGGTIKTWLENNKSCPMCKEEVVL